jgi:hypothetical protein
VTPTITFTPTATETPTPAAAALTDVYRAQDGTVYQVIFAPNGLPGGEDEYRITTVAGAAQNVTACSGLFDLGAGALDASALVGRDSSLPGSVHPFGAMARTTVLSPTALVGSFDPAGGGRLVVGNGANPIDVCRSPLDCTGGAMDAAVVAMTTADPAVPAACLRTNVVAFCAGMTSKTTVAFGLPADASHNCLNPPTTDVFQCNARPSDGISLNKGQAIVFIYQDLFMSSFTIGWGGFGIDTDGVNVAACPSMSVVGAHSTNPMVPN